MAGQIPKKRLRTDEFRRLAEAEQWTTQSEIAAALGVHQSQVSRVLDELVRPGERFIDGCVRIWGHAVVYGVLLVDDGDGAEDGEAA